MTTRADAAPQPVRDHSRRRRERARRPGRRRSAPRLGRGGGRHGPGLQPADRGLGPARGGPTDAAWQWELLVHPTTSPRPAAAWEAAVRTGRPYEHEHRIRMADGGWRWHLSRGVRTTNRATGETCWYGTATDIDTGRRAEELLRQTQSSLALAMRGGRMGWWTRDLETEAVTWSPELEALFGLPVGTFGGRRGGIPGARPRGGPGRHRARRPGRHREPDRLRRRVPLPPRRRHDPLDGRPRPGDL